MRIPAELLLAFAIAQQRANGASQEAAEATAYAVMHASLHGIESHGIRLLPWYGEQLRTRTVNPAPTVTVERKRRAGALVDAGGGFGHLASYRAMDEACALARENGIGMASVRNSAHFGAAGAYALAAADAGLIGFATSNAAAMVIPFQGTSPIHGTNPIAFAAPNPAGDPFLLDMATSSIPWNRVLRSRTENMELPPDTAIDEAGRYTLEADAARMLGPIGGALFGYKGAAFAGLAEILSATLTGMRLSTEQDPLAVADTGVGQFFMAIDPEAFVTRREYEERIGKYIATFEPPSMAAGGPQWAARAERARDGIPILPGLEAELRAEAEKSGISFP